VRELIYAVEGKQANLRTFAVDERTNGGANHHYRIENSAAKKPTIEELDDILNGATCTPGAAQLSHGVDIYFQNGPIQEAGINGIQNEDLIAIIIDRLQGFQAYGPYKCRENAIALTHLEDALHWLQHRTRQRIARGVEGTHTV
jgi:hypothetical protein